ncbi:unnamed protein product [Heligmosomoides polygyrus]|uniref:Transposase n=1 Tax=Heligmosomoides polygyrus TaxID=6339 RepID=A0A183F3M7_HELPZ|nr:unnamed protein product [Heligmosomoides polygyrus]
MTAHNLDTSHLRLKETDLNRFYQDYQLNWFHAGISGQLIPDKVNHIGEGPIRTIVFAGNIALVAGSQKKLEKVQLWQAAVADDGLVKKKKFIKSENCTEPIVDFQG